MGTTPPDEDEQSDQNRPAPGSAKSLQRNHNANSRRPQRQYYSDEHPEVPHVKRASRDRIASESDTPLRRKATSKAASGEEEDNSAEHELPSQLEAKSVNRIVVAQQRRSSIYEPPSTPDSRPQRSEAAAVEPILQPPMRIRLRRQTEKQQQTWFVFGSIALVVVLIIVVLANATHNTPIALPRTTKVQPPAFSSSNPHELIITPSDTTHPTPPVYATSAYLLDADTGTTLYAHNPFVHLPMLSTTKLMTAVLAVEQGQPDQNIVINSQMVHDIGQLAADSSVMNIRPGETYTLRELLEGMLLVSGNDAAVVIADEFAGSQQKFVDEMNRKAAALGLHDTHYVNPHGLLQAGQYSCAHDLAILGAYALSQPLIHQIASTQSIHLNQTATHAAHNFPNGNMFIWWYPGVDGGKPGWDASTDYVQVVSSVRNHKHLIGVTMHTNDWWTDMRDLLNWGFDDFSWVSPHDAVLNNIPVPFAADWNNYASDTRDRTIPTPDHGRYYVYSGYSISDPIMGYFDQNNGFSILGYPSSQPRMVSTKIITQHFDHGTIQCDLGTKSCKTV